MSDYDLRTYLKKIKTLPHVFRGAFAPADHAKVFSEDPTVLVGGIVPQARELRRFGMDDQWYEVAYGAKLRKKPIRNRFFRETDRVEYADMVEKHGEADLHVSALGGYGEHPRRAEDLGYRVRTGDFYCECECKTVSIPEAGGHQPLRGLSLLSAQTLVQLLVTELSLDPERDLRLFYNGNHDIIVKIRQSAFGIPDIIGLERHWGRFAEHLEPRLRQAPAVADAIRAVGKDPDKVRVLDLHMYLATSLLRVVNTPHHETGRYCVPISVDELNAAQSIADLHPLAQAPRDETPFDATEEVEPLRKLRERLTRDLPKQETFDPNAHAQSEQAKAKMAQRARKAQRRARSSPNAPSIPCVDHIKALIAAGDSIGFILCVKLLCEARFALGLSDNDVAEILTSGAGGPMRYVSGGRVEPDPRPDEDRNACGFRVNPHLWPEDEDEHRQVGCRNPEVLRVCAYERCYRADEMFTFDEDGSPSFDDFREEGRRKLVMLMDQDPPLGAFELVQCTTRAGKTWQVTRRSAERANLGQKSWIVVPTHDVGRTVEGYARDQRILGGDKLLLHVHGRNEMTCATECTKGSCSGCSRGLTLRTDQQDADGKPVRPQNPRVAALLAETHTGVYGYAELKALAEKHELCVRTVGWALVPQADILVLPHAYLCQDTARDILPPAPDYIYVDEADQLPDGLQAESIERLPLSYVRHSAARSLRDGVCGEQCPKCHLDFVTRYHQQGGRFDVDSQLGAVDEGADPARLIGFLRLGLALLQRFEGAALTVPGLFALTALAGNIELLSECLPAPRRLLPVAEHVSPADYFKALAKHLTSSDFLAAYPRVRAVPGLKSDETLAVVLRFDPCLAVPGRGDESDESDDEAPRDRFRTEFGHIDLRRFFRPEFFSQDKLAALSDDEREALHAILRFAIYTNTAARDSSGAVLVGAWRPWSGAEFIRSCRLELQFCNAARFACVRELLSSSRTIMLSGTHLNREHAAHVLLMHDALVSYRPLDVPMHKRITLVQHHTDPGGHTAMRGQHIGLKTLFGGFVQGLIDALHAVASPLPGRLWPRLLLFCRSKQAARDALRIAQRLPGTVRVEHRGLERGLLEIREEHAAEHGGDAQCTALVTIDYLRSSGSRGIDRGYYDVIVGCGNGYPDFGGYWSYLAEVNQVSGREYSVDELAGYNRDRSYWQAMLRAAGDGDRQRVIVTISDAGVMDVPDFLLNRRLAATEFFRGIHVSTCALLPPRLSGSTTRRKIDGTADFCDEVGANQSSCERQPCQIPSSLAAFPPCSKSSRPASPPPRFAPSWC